MPCPFTILHPMAFFLFSSLATPYQRGKAFPCALPDQAQIPRHVGAIHALLPLWQHGQSRTKFCLQNVSNNFAAAYVTGGISGTAFSDTLNIGGISLPDQTLGLAEFVSQDFGRVTCDGLFVSSLSTHGLFANVLMAMSEASLLFPNILPSPQLHPC